MTSPESVFIRFRGVRARIDVDEYERKRFELSSTNIPKDKRPLTRPLTYY